MNIFVARQPIYDRRGQVYGYELLFRQNSNNYFIDIDDDAATSDVIYNTFLVFGIDNITDDTRAFINCSKAMIESDFLKMLPKDKIVFEILERGTPTQATLDACKLLKSIGYTLALDDFVLTEETKPLLDYADIVKLEFQKLGFDQQKTLIRQYRNKVKFLAEKIETSDDYAKALELGYEYYQGYYFSRPSMMNSKDISSMNVNLIRIIEELNRPEPSYSYISDIIASDLGLSYKLLKLVNSAYIAPRFHIKSILQALNYLGMRELHQWMSLMLLKDFQDGENSELIKRSLVRGKLMSALAQNRNRQTLSSEYFFTGIFSMIDIILNKRIEDILTDLPLSDKVKHALSGEKNELRQLLDYIVSFENAQWQDMNRQPVLESENADQFMTFYIEALRWAKQVSQI